MVFVVPDYNDWRAAKKVEFLMEMVLFPIWATSWQNLQNGM